MPILAIPVAAVVIAALLAVIALLAYEQLTKIITHMVPAWHLPGLGSFRDWITSHLHEGYNALAGYLDGYVHQLTVFLTAPVTFLRVMTGQIVSAFAATHLLLWAIVNHLVPLAISQAKAYAVKLTAAVEAKALAWYHSALQNADDLAHYLQATLLAAIAATEAQALAWYHSALQNADDLAHYLQATLLAAIAATEAQALAWYHSALQNADDLARYVQGQAVALYQSALVTIEQRYQQAIAYAAAIAKAESLAVVHGLNQELVTDIELAWPAVIAGIDDVIDVADGAFTDVVDDLRGISRELPLDLPAAIAATTAIAVPLLRLAKDCTMPNCRNLSGFGNAFQDILGLVEGGAIIALLSEAVADPAGTSAVLENVLAPLLDGAAGSVRSQVGVG